MPLLNIKPTSVSCERVSLLVMEGLMSLFFSQAISRTSGVLMTCKAIRYDNFKQKRTNLQKRCDIQSKYALKVFQIQTSQREIQQTTAIAETTIAETTTIMDKLSEKTTF